MFVFEPVLKAFLRFNHFDKYIFEEKNGNVYDLIIHISLPVYIFLGLSVINCPNSTIQPIEGKKYNLCVFFLRLPVKENQEKDISFKYFIRFH